MTHRTDEQFEHLAEGYFDQALNRAGEERLAELMREDDRRVRRFAELAQLHQMIASEIGYRKQTERFGLSQQSADSDAVVPLAGMDEIAAPPGLDFAAWQFEQRSAAARERAHKRKRVASIAGIAALIVLAGVLAFVLLSPGNQQAPLAQGDTQQPAERTVARLTGQQDAVWQDAAGRVIELRIQDKLTAGQRLTLVRGFAELTTNHGAMAKLEGPCTVGLVDHDNALRLHAGKLVGICETASSKGFTVRTPQMDVIDLGTRFGVAVEEDGQTLTEVFTGRVTVQPARETPGLFKSTQLVSGGAMALSSAGHEIDRDQFETDVFVGLIEPDDGPARLSGDIQWATASDFIKGYRAKWPVEDHAQLFEEFSRVQAQSAIPVTFHRPGIYKQFEAIGPSSVIQPGTGLRSYVVIFNWDNSVEQTDHVVEGEVTFKGRVVGIIVNQEQHIAFVNAIGPLGKRAWRDAWAYRGPKAKVGDQVVLGKDGRSVGFRFEAVNEEQDDKHFSAVRVLVAEDE